MGGNHFRAWKQDGPLGRTGAWFLAYVPVSLLAPILINLPFLLLGLTPVDSNPNVLVSHPSYPLNSVSAEHSLLFHHSIVPNGYDLGRDLLISRAVQGNLPIYAPPYNFQSVPGYVWKADLTWERGLLDVGRKGLNHNITIDGRVAVLTVRRLSGTETGNGTQTGKVCGTGDGETSNEVPCQHAGNQLTGGKKTKEDIRKGIAFWVRAANFCGKVLRIMFGGIQGMFSTMIW